MQAALDKYFLGIVGTDLEIEPLRKQETAGLRRFVRMVRFDQDQKLKELAVRSGKKVSQITREAVEEYLGKAEKN